MPEPVHDEALVNLYLEQISALSISAFDGADVGQELSQIVREAVDQCRASKATPAGNNLSVTKNGLELKRGAPYYFSVRAENRAGLPPRSRVLPTRQPTNGRGNAP